MLLIKQMTGVWRVHNPALVELVGKCRQVAGGLEYVRFSHVMRERNAVADALANRAMDTQEDGEELLLRPGRDKAGARGPSR